MEENSYGFVVVSNQGRDISGTGTKDAVNAIKCRLMDRLTCILKDDSCRPEFVRLGNSIFTLSDIQAVVFKKQSDLDIDFTINIGTE